MGSLTLSSCSISTLSKDRHPAVKQSPFTPALDSQLTTATLLPGHAGQGLGHVLAGVGADLGEHDVAVLRAGGSVQRQRRDGGPTVLDQRFSYESTHGGQLLGVFGGHLPLFVHVHLVSQQEDGNPFARRFLEKTRRGGHEVATSSAAGG